MKHAIVCVAALLLLAPTVTRAQSTGTLVGRVTDSLGQPLISVTVRIDGTKLGGFTKKPDGGYTIVGIPPGDYTVIFSMLGYHPDSISVSISVDRRTQLDAVLGVGPIRQKPLTVHADRTGSRPPISRRRLDDRRMEIIPTQPLPALLGSLAGVQAGSAGVSIQGGRPNQTTTMVDGTNQSDPFVGGNGSMSAAYSPTPSTLSLYEIDLLKSGFGAEYGMFSGGYNLVTRTGKSSEYEGVFRYRTNLPALYGSSRAITVGVPGSDRDTTLSPARYQSSGRSLYEFGVGGPIPGVKDITFYISGKYEPIDHTGSGYEVYDMSPEYARARAPIARQMWGMALEPTNLGQLPHQSAMIRDITAKFRANLSNSIILEAGGELGATSLEHGSWSSLYKFDHPVFRRGDVAGAAVYDTVTGLLERDVQQTNENTLIRRAYLKYTQALSDVSFLEVSASLVDRSFERGRKDESKRYGLFDMYDIYEPIDADGDVIIDRYALTSRDASSVQYSNSPYTAFGRNDLTGLIEGAASAGASRNPYGLNDLRFPVHGNSEGFEQRTSRTINLKGAYETNMRLGEVTGAIKAGFELSAYTLRRHSNSLPWDQNPFFDIYGYSANYFRYKDTSGALKEFFAAPYKPWEGALYLSASLDYKSITLQPSVRFDFYDPNTFSSPEQRATFRDVLRSLEQGGDAAMKFQVSPRLSIGYPITDRSQARVNFSMLYRRPEFNLMFDNAYGDALRGNQLFGNPDILPERQYSYEVGYRADLDETYSLDVSAFYRDIYNLTGVSYVPTVPTPYVIYSVQEFGNVRGLEVMVQRRPVDGVQAEINYTLQRAVGTASSPAASYATAIGETDPYTGEARRSVMVEYPLNYDQTHRLNGLLAFIWNDGQGPSIGGVRILQNTTISLNGSFATGLPYTLETSKGVQVSEFNGMRLPATFSTQAHLEKAFKLRDVLGESVGGLELSIFADIFNLFNNTDPVSVNFSRSIGGSLFSITGNPDDDGRSLSLGIGEFSATPYYRDVNPARPETFSSSQYDRYGSRLYNPYADLNLDGVVTQGERYEGYRRFVATVQSLRSAYQTPRTVAVGFKVKF